MANNLRNTLGPLFLMSVCPPFVMLMWYTNTSLNGSALQLWNTISQHGLFTTLYRIWQPYFFGSTTAWLMIATFAIFQLILMKAVPGKPFAGPVSPKGNIPIYKANGFAAYLITMLTFFACTFVFNLFPATILYDQLGALFGALNFAS